MAVLAEKAQTRKTNAAKKRLPYQNALGAESIQKMLFYLLEKIDKLDHKPDNRVDKLDDKIDKLNDKIDSRFLWTTGIMFTGFIGIVAIILPKH